MNFACESVALAPYTFLVRRYEMKLVTRLTWICCLNMMRAVDSVSLIKLAQCWIFPMASAQELIWYRGLVCALVFALALSVRWFEYFDFVDWFDPIAVPQSLMPQMLLVFRLTELSQIT